MWLINSTTAQIFSNAEKSGAMPSAEQQLDYEARIGSGSGDMPRLLTIAGENAQIEINGAITNRPSLYAYMFGGGNTTYGDINAAIAVAEADPTIEKITLSIDSPGGTIAGLFETIDAIQAAKKPIETIVSNMAASAAYAIAASTNKITVTNRAAMIGSVGIVVSGYVDPDEVTITSTNAPKKRPNMHTEEGQAVVREELDALHDIFVDSIAAGRKVTDNKVNSDYGQGATLLAEEALSRGMIDGIQGKLSVVPTSSTTAHKGTTTEGSIMDLLQLQAQHPDVHAAAVQVGATNERDRVSAHLTMGEASGDMTTAITAIVEGSEMTAALQATYMAAGMNRSTIAASQDDSDNADAGDQAVLADAEQADAATATLQADVFERCGVELKGAK